ncbi:MAG: hypothetical protein H7Z13_12275 [Ferruginibacter sp.]|nr:hypothetical protein [Ferruginibacter sp.]
MKRIVLYSGVLTVLALSACKKQTEEFLTASIEEYSPLVVGKFITYQLDTFKYLKFGVKDTIVTYQVKHVIDALINDNLGRPAYRIIRYIRKTPQQPWLPDNSFTTVNTGTSLEFIENNQRFLKLKLPVRDGYSWKGNTYIDTYSLNSTVRYLDDWDYMYEGINEPLNLGNIHLDSTLTVNQRDEVIGIPSNPTSYSERNVGLEVYAKGIGLVYRKFLHTIFQPATPGVGAAYTDDSYGVTFTMIDHN